MSASAPAARLAALDIVKGALVLLMVLYHWLNYFVGVQGDYYRYLRFLTPSFIFIAGFLVSHLYLRKYPPGDARMHGRLLLRGTKLLAVFTLLNIAEAFVTRGFSPEALDKVVDFFANALNAYLLGNGNPAAFSVLAPISYVLIFLSGYLWLTKGGHRADFALCTILFGLIYILHRHGEAAGYLELFTCGMIGFLSGRLTPEQLRGLGAFRFELAALYACYLILLTEWQETLPMQILGVVASLALLQSLAANNEGKAWIARRVVTLGSYSLLAYIVQIAVLVLLAKVLRRFEFGPVVQGGAFVAAFALTGGLVELVDWLRRRSRLVEGMYRFAFN
jgi:peptidoglycan/LPS O-acetylase OafA/YrhL